MPPRDTDKAALDAFKTAFGEVVPIRSKDAKIRLGKVMIALEQVEKAIAWARECGFSNNQVQEYQMQYDALYQIAEQYSQQRSPDMKEMETLKETCRHLADTIRKKRTKQKLNDLPNNSGIFVHDVPGLDDLDDNARQAKIEQVRQQVCRGGNLTSGILQNDQNYQGVAPTKETVVDMCWYFKGMAQEKLGEPYQQGAMTLPDPDGRLAKFLDSCPEIYPRDSSHLRPQQSQGGSQGRGLDVGGAFPGGMNTVLFHPYVTDRGERRLYVKFETAGAYGHLRTTSREVARRPENENDREQSDNHAKSFMGGGKDKDLAETREGTVDLAVQAAYQALYDAAPDYRRHLEPGRQKSKQNAQGEITGFSRALSFTPFAPNYWDVQTQATNVRNFVDAIKHDDDLKRRYRAPFMDWYDAMTDAGYRTDAYQRLGDEVVLQPNDLQQVQSNVQTDGDIDSDRALIKMYDLIDVQMGNQARLLEGRKKDIPYVFYKKLVFTKPNAQRKVLENVLLVDTEVRQFEDCIEPNTKVAAGIINKGTNLLKRKYFEYTGNVTQGEMLLALSATGWNMANLTQATDLKKKG